MSAFLLLVGGEINAHIGRHLPRRETRRPGGATVEAINSR
jgi:hypothetical protein